MDRRYFLITTGTAAPLLAIGAMPMNEANATQPSPGQRPMRLFLGGDVMTGRGIDQILPSPGDPRLHESWVKSAIGYLELAEAAHGPIPRKADPAYPWGDALQALARVGPDLRIINLETAVTRSDEHWTGKAVHYRMHPANVDCLRAAGIDCCTLANNHVLDWGYPGLEQTLATLERAGVRATGAGADLAAAAAPAVLEVPGKGRVLVFAFGSPTSGIPDAWAATERRAGVNLLPDFSERSVQRIARAVRAFERDGDVVVASIHWGGNWGYEIDDEQRAFAHRLIDAAGVDLVHGHSSHHPKAIEVYRDRPILYGCGDLLNDYEGIGGYERFRSDLALLYFATMDPASGGLVQLDITPMQIRKFRLNHPSETDARWLRERLGREYGRFGHRLERHAEPPGFRLLL
jgi:poly-gamma-glutamate synthesis protein (capsule biosynthesis protein)